MRDPELPIGSSRSLHPMSTLRHPFTALAGLALVLALAGCGGAADTPDEADATDASMASQSAAASDDPTAGDDAVASEDGGEAAGLCAIVPIDQVETALGMSTDGGVDDESFLSGGFTCRFTGDADHVLDVETSDQTRDEWFEAIETVGLTDEEITGVGEEAYRAAETALGGPGARFTAWSNGHEVGVTIYSDEPQEVTFAAAQAIAEAVLAAGE
jgi:hypothetical protein